MITSVHSRGRVIDLWTGEAFDAAVRFKIPTGDGKKWKGCYATPSTALAALRAHLADTLRDKPDHQAQLVDLFQSSLRRSSDPDPRTNDFVVLPAPHHSELADFGGALTLDQFHARYNHALQRRMFTQALRTGGEDEGGEEPSGDTQPRPWHARSVAVTAGTSEDGDARQQTLPRCVKGWLDFLREHAIWTQSVDAITIYLSRKDKYCFALGPPAAYFNKANPRASAYFDTAVYGTVHVFKHSPIKLPGEDKRKRARADSGADEQAPSKAQKAGDTPAGDAASK